MEQLHAKWRNKDLNPGTWKNKCIHLHGIPLGALTLMPGREATGYFVHFWNSTLLHWSTICWAYEWRGLPESLPTCSLSSNEVAPPTLYTHISPRSQDPNSFFVFPQLRIYLLYMSCLLPSNQVIARNSTCLWQIWEAKQQRTAKGCISDSQIKPLVAGHLTVVLTLVERNLVRQFMHTYHTLMGFSYIQIHQSTYLGRVWKQESSYWNF